ncbi:MAG: hypothetical protein ACYC9O_07515 [Candidatus Latescibacterota bacterium]
MNRVNRNIAAVCLGMAVPLAVISLLTEGCSKPPEEIPEFIMEAKKGDELVWSGRGSLRYDFVYPDSAKVKTVTYNKEGTVQEYVVTSSKAEIDFAFDRERFSCTVTNYGRLDPPHEAFAYDGEKVYQYTEGVFADDAIPPKTGSIEKELGYIPLDRFDPRFIGMTVLNEPVGSFLETVYRENGPESVVILKEEYVDSTLCRVVQAAPRKNPTEKGRVYTLWLAPEYGWRMLKFDRRNSEEQATARIHYRKIGDAGWFPREIVLDRKLGDKHDIHQTLVSLADWEINIPLPDSLFRIDFPRGTRVTDRWTGRTYTVK